MIDVEGDDLIPLSDLRDWIHRKTGMMFATSTIYHWAARGVRGRKLDVIRFGGRIFTSEGAFLRWISPDVGGQDRDRMSLSGRSAKIAERLAGEVFG